MDGPDTNNMPGSGGIKHTLNDGQQDDNDKEEECDVEKDSETFRGVAVCWLNLITYSILNFNRSV